MSSLKEIVPGKTYASEVTVTEEVNGEKVVFRFLFQSYFVGMYMALYSSGSLIAQGGYHDNKTIMKKLKKDLSAAMLRGATVEIGTVHAVVSG